MITSSLIEIGLSRFRADPIRTSLLKEEKAAALKANTGMEFFFVHLKKKGRQQNLWVKSHSRGRK